MKLNAQIELLKLDLPVIINKMNSYAAMRIKSVDIKKLNGMEPQDFTSNTILKVLDGRRDWLNASTDDMIAFLMMCLKSEISHFLEVINKREITLVDMYDEKLLSNNYIN